MLYVYLGEWNSVTSAWARSYGVTGPAALTRVTMSAIRSRDARPIEVAGNRVYRATIPVG